MTFFSIVVIVVPLCFATQFVFANRSGVAASRFLAAAAACVILVCFAAENCKSSWSGRITVAMVIAAKFLLKSAPKPSIFAAISAAIMYVKVSLCKSWLCVKTSLCKSLSV